MNNFQSLELSVLWANFNVPKVFESFKVNCIFIVYIQVSFMCVIPQVNYHLGNLSYSLSKHVVILCKIMEKRQYLCIGQVRDL